MMHTNPSVLGFSKRQICLEAQIASLSWKLPLLCLHFAILKLLKRLRKTWENSWFPARDVSPLSTFNFFFLLEVQMPLYFPGSFSSNINLKSSRGRLGACNCSLYLRNTSDRECWEKCCCMLLSENNNLTNIHTHNLKLSSVMTNIF